MTVQCLDFFFFLLKHKWSQFTPGMLTSIWVTVKAVWAVKAKQVRVQSAFWLVCGEGGVIKYHLYWIPGTSWCDLRVLSCNDLQVLSLNCSPCFATSLILQIVPFFFSPRNDPKLSPGQRWRLSPISWRALPVTSSLCLSSDSVSSSLPTATALDTLWCAVVCWACQCHSNLMYA